MKIFKIVVHGGAGTIRKEDMRAELEKAYKAGIKAAIHAGYKILAKRGSSLDAVRAAVVTLEDNILFNAGCGSVFTKDGKHEMDAAIMDGKTMKAGAVAGVKNIRNPVELAYSIMTQSRHVMLSGQGAEEFARLQGIKTEPDEYFFSDFRYKQWKQLRETDSVGLDHNVKPQSASESRESLLHHKKSGTVGAVALDLYGNLAAATSTGGMTNKQWGRIGDSPIIGAGTYANNHTCAISCTGHGEPFIRAVAAYDVSCLMEYKGLSLVEAMHTVVYEKLPKFNGEGGMIGIDAKGNAAMVFNSDGMYRGVKGNDGVWEISIYK